MYYIWFLKILYLHLYRCIAILNQKNILLPNKFITVISIISQECISHVQKIVFSFLNNEYDFAHHA